jgi:hypothetical protein
VCPTQRSIAYLGDITESAIRIRSPALLLLAEDRRRTQAP